jgi:DNA-directed RNA polymerase specialized sigma24 family protein
LRPVPIDGYSDRYSIDAYGNVYSWWDNKGRRRETPEMRRVSVTHEGYHWVSIHRRVSGLKRSKRGFVHRWVCMAFNGPQPSSVHECAHLDGNKANNHYSNLAWVTKKENESHKVQHGTVLTREKNHAAKLDQRMANACIALVDVYKMSYSQVGKIFDIRYQTVQKIVAKERARKLVGK